MSHWGLPWNSLFPTEGCGSTSSSSIQVPVVNETCFEIHSLASVKSQFTSQVLLFGLFLLFFFLTLYFFERSFPVEGVLSMLPLVHTCKNNIIFLGAESQPKCFQETSMFSWAPKRGVSAWPTESSMSQGQAGLAKTTSEVATEKADPLSIAGNQGSLTVTFQRLS